MTAKMQMTVELNGVQRRAVVEPRDTLVDLIRDTFGLTGTPRGCEEGVTNHCIVLVDGEPVNANLMFAVQTHGRSVTTIEGLSRDGLSPLQAALVADGVAGCGIGLPGVVMLLESAKARNDCNEADLETLVMSSGCGCSALQHALRLLKSAAAQDEVESGGAAAE